MIGETMPVLQQQQPGGVHVLNLNRRAWDAISSGQDQQQPVGDNFVRFHLAALHRQRQQHAVDRPVMQRTARRRGQHLVNEQVEPGA